MKKKIIVLGAAGLVGMNLLAILVKKPYSGKYEIVAIDKNAHNMNLLRQIFPSVKGITADLNRKCGKEQKDNWEKEFKDAYCVIQLQAQIASPKREQFVKNNIQSVKRVLQLCRKYGVKNLIHLSSSVVISVANDNYTNTKKLGQALVVKSKVPYTILRPPLMYGCFDAKHLGWITRMMEKTPIMPIPGNGKYMRQPLYVMDLCRIIAKIIDKPRDNKIYDIIGRERINFIDLLKRIAKARGMKKLFVPIPIPVFIQMVKAHGIATGMVSSLESGASSKKQPAFIPDQLKALIAGDDFPVKPWWKTFGVEYTPFDKAMKETVNSPYDKYSKKMVNPN